MNISKLGESCETTNINGELQPSCSGDMVCVHLDQNTEDVRQNGNTSVCVDCEDPQWSWDCEHWDWQTLNPAMELCGKTCDTFDKRGSKEYYVDFFNNFNPKLWYKDLPCVEYASWIEDGEMVISLQKYTDDDSGTYGGCVYTKGVYGSGNYSVDMTPFSKITDGYISTFYMYSENLTYTDHDEIDFEFRSGNQDSSNTNDLDKNVWTNVFHTTGEADSTRVCGGGVECTGDYYKGGSGTSALGDTGSYWWAWGRSKEIKMDQSGDTEYYASTADNDGMVSGGKSTYDASYEGTNSHNFRIEYVMGEYVKWYVDEKLVRTETFWVPTHKMAIRLSVWFSKDAAADSWSGALDTEELPVYVKYQGLKFTFDEYNKNCKGDDGGQCTCEDFAFDTDKASCS